MAAPTPEELERRLEKLDSRLTSMTDSLNRINQTTADRVVALETKVTSMVGSLNKINQTTADHIKSLEKKFVKLDKVANKTAKTAEPKKMERSISEIVDKALAAYDKAKGK